MSAADAFLGEFTLNPADPEFQELRSVCEPGNPWRCLIATKGSMELGRRMTVRLDHETNTGVIGVTYGDHRFERPMTALEVGFARRFDLGEPLRRPIRVTVDLNDGTWTAKPKRVGPGGAKTAANNHGRGPGNKAIKAVRARQLEAIRRQHAAHAEAGEKPGVTEHGYAAYTGGCRCKTCTAAKAAYMRDRRAAARVADTPFTHGTRFGYEERGCRCADCVAAEQAAGRLATPAMTA